MLNIRLQRVGRKKVPAFRVVLVDSHRGPKTGSVKEVLGSYNPQFDKAELAKDRILHWMKMGAKPSDTMHNLLINEKVIEGKKINVLPRKSPPKKEDAAAASAQETTSPEGGIAAETPAAAPEASATEASSETPAQSS